MKELSRIGMLVSLALIAEAVDGREVSVVRLAAALVVGARVRTGIAEEIVVFLKATVFVFVEVVEIFRKVAIEILALRLTVFHRSDEEVFVARRGHGLAFLHRVL